MLTKIIKSKVIFSAIILMACFFVLSPAKAQTSDILDIEFESGINSGTGMYNPLFTEANILPGESVTRWVEVTNKTNEIIPIAARAINAVDNGLGDALILSIVEQGIGTPAYSDELADFFMLDGVYLSNLAANSTATYDFTVYFDDLAGNEYNNNESNLIFDIAVGDGTDESFGGEDPGSGGGYYYQGLVISEEQVVQISDVYAIVTWLTNIPATSRVVYDKVSHHDLSNTTAPNYGYASSTIEDLSKTEPHSVDIYGLEPSTTYYFRPLSKASPEKYGKELSFTTTADPDEVIVLGKEYARDLSEEEEEPSVLGWEGEFAATGFSKKEFAILISFVLIFSLTAFILKRKDKQKE